MRQQDLTDRQQNMQRSASDKKCPVCSGTGFEILQCKELKQIDSVRFKAIIDAHMEVYQSDTISQGYAIPCRRCNGSHAVRVETTRERANIPSSFYDNRIYHFDWTIYKNEKGEKLDLVDKKNAVDSFINDFKKWDNEGMGLFICSGMKGSGKTFLASCICNSLIDKYPMGTKFVSASQLLNISKNSDGSGNYDTDQLALLCKCKLLVIDDIGQKNCGSDWMNDVLFQIVDARYQAKLVTIFTSNMNIQRLSDLVDERITDRINKMTFQLTLPEYCVRAKEANEQKMKFLKTVGLM